MSRSFLTEQGDITQNCISNDVFIISLHVTRLETRNFLLLIYEDDGNFDEDNVRDMKYS